MPRKSAHFPLAAAESRRLLRERTGRAHVLLTGRAATAIWAALRALDLHDRAVLLPSNTCYIVLWAVILSGNRPVLVDVDPLTANISPATLAACAGANPAVLIPAHMYGLPAPIASLTEWAGERGVFVIEDAALALGTRADGKPAGAWGDVSVLSFGEGKIADADGGGALLTDDPSLAAEIERVLATVPLQTQAWRRLNHEWLEIYWALHQFDAQNPRLKELYPTLFSIYAPITLYRLPDSHWRDLRSALVDLDANLAHRRELAHLYDEKLADFPVRLLKRPADAILWRYPLLIAHDQRDALLERLWAAQIFEATRWYPSLQPMAQALAPTQPITPTPAADHLADEIINLPLTPGTEREKALKAVAIIRRYFEA